MTNTINSNETWKKSFVERTRSNGLVVEGSSIAKLSCEWV